MGIIDYLPRSLQKKYFTYIRPHIFRRYHALTKIIQEHRCKKIMEIGVWTGMQAEIMIREAKKKNGTSVEYYGFDLFEDMTPELFKKAVAKQPPNMNDVQKDLSKLGVRVQLFKGPTTETIPKATKKIPIMDLIYIDGDHSIEGVTADWNNIQPLMNYNTIVVFDDYWNRTTEGAKPLVDSINRKKYDVTILSTKDRTLKKEGILTIQFAVVQKKQKI